MKSSRNIRSGGFTLLETVIAIGVLAVLLTGFMVVFAPAAEGIRKSINVQQADRLASTLEQELVTLREGEESTDIKTGFDKAYMRIKESNNVGKALLVYQYRGKVSDLRSDGTPEPEPQIDGKLPGKDYVVVSMMRTKDDPLFNSTSNGDITAIEGGIYLVKCTQLVFNGGELTLGKPGEIKDPKGIDNSATSPDTYPEAVIAFAADFHIMPSKAASYYNSGGGFDKKFTSVRNPVFTRNLAVRR